MASGALPYYTSQSLVSAVQRKISMPLSQNTFSSDDVLAFANEELALAQVPQILTYHEEYFVFLQIIPLNPNQLSYPIPDRSIGMRLRSLFYVDTNGNRFEMVRVNPDDKSFFQYTNGNNESAFRYYLQGNDIVLTPASLPSPIGSLEFGYYLRPNQLVDNSRAATITGFFTNIIATQSLVSPGDQFLITNNITATEVALTAIASGVPLTGQFLIGSTDNQLATNLAAAILATGMISSVLVTGNNINILYNNIQMLFTTTNIVNAFNIQGDLGIQVDQVPANITTATPIDFLQTGSGHRTFAISVPIDSISGNNILVNIKYLQTTLVGTIGNLQNVAFNPTLVTNNIQIGDYICQQYECIIPQIPSDLHTGLADRTCARILSAIGDQQGLQAAQQKIQEDQTATNPLLGARIDGDGKKVFPRKTLLRYGKFINYRRF